MNFYRFYFTWRGDRCAGLIQADNIEEATLIFKENYGTDVFNLTIEKTDFHHGVCEVYYGG